ncbi:hybrid sensor histidine kinase/response regulator [Hydrogenophaga sp. 5NK40-0174]|uniref:ATP-binding response regulator n=1 Tax=Hydrogenophaga sp. 5NK40-0174 TaxID=3127649 RepID=UPI0031086A16
MTHAPKPANLSPGTRPPHTILLVDDEAQACKWFSRLYGDEFAIATAGSGEEALDFMSAQGRQVAVLVSDYRMPGMTGVQLLRRVSDAHPHVVGLLASAYADKDVALQAVNEGKVHAILEKPLSEAGTRAALREALALSVRKASDKVLLEQRATSQREILGFLAHEVTTPLVTVRAYLQALRDRVETAGEEEAEGGAVAVLSQNRPGEVIQMLEAAQRRAGYAQSLVSTFVQTARDSAAKLGPVTLQASDLLQAVSEEYPFEEGQAHCLQCEVEQDFSLPGRRDLLYLVVCTLIKNALLAMDAAGTEDPAIVMRLDRSSPAPGLARLPVLQVIDNGPGIEPDILARLTREPVTTRQRTGGTGMGVLFCQRVMSSLGGSVDVRSTLGQGTAVTLYFPQADAGPPDT